nr:hypothetical protein CFP56_09897 [Quercus suber]
MCADISSIALQHCTLGSIGHPGFADTEDTNTESSRVIKTRETETDVGKSQCHLSRRLSMARAERFDHMGSPPSWDC